MGKTQSSLTIVGDSAPRDNLGCCDLVGGRVFLASGGWRQEHCPEPTEHWIAPTVKNERTPEVSRLRLRGPELINAVKKARG